MYWVCELSEECRVSVDIVAFVSLNSCSRQSFLPLCILTLFVPVRRVRILDVRHISFRCEGLL